MRRFGYVLALLAAVGLLPTVAGAEVMKFSQASFHGDAPLETFVGTSPLEGIQGDLVVDPAKRRRPRVGEGGHESRHHRHREAKQKAVERVADGTVTYIKLTPEQVEQQKRFGFTRDNLKVKAKLGSAFTDHGMQVPQILFLKVANDIQMAVDIVFVRQ
jgi:hypothetical protein